MPDGLAASPEAQGLRTKDSNPTSSIEFWEKELWEQRERSLQVLRLEKSGKLEKTMREFGVNGPLNTYEFSRRNKVAYSVAHGLIKRLEELGFVKVVSKVKNEKGVAAKLYGLTLEGFISAIRFSKNEGELERVVKGWSENDKSGLLEKWDYIVGKVGPWRAEELVKQSISDQHPVDRFVNEILLYVTSSEPFDEHMQEFLGSTDMALLMDDEQLRVTTLAHIEGRTEMINDEIARLRDEEKFCQKLYRIFQKNQRTGGR